MQPILLDTGVIAGCLNRRDYHHARCVAAMAKVKQPIVTCEAVIVESFYLLQSIPAAVDDILANVAKGTFQIPFQLSECASEIQQILRKYRDTPCDFADACLVHLADQLGTGDILTLDSDFRHYRWRRNKRFRMLISLD
ncbi:MAG: PIN domain-containing protein [Terracidiphilus sp.]